MTDIFLEFDDALHDGHHQKMSIRKDLIILVAPSGPEKTSTLFFVREFDSAFTVPIPYDKFIKQFIVIKMEEKK